MTKIRLMAIIACYCYRLAAATITIIMFSGARLFSAMAHGRLGNYL
jgi:hypothetical protein